MRIIAAYLLSVLGGNDKPDAAAVKKILDAVGVTAEDEQFKKLIAELDGKDINDIIAEVWGHVMCVCIWDVATAWNALVMLCGMLLSCHFGMHR